MFRRNVQPIVSERFSYQESQDVGNIHTVEIGDSVVNMYGGRSIFGFDSGSLRKIPTTESDALGIGEND